MIDINKIPLPLLETERLFLAPWELVYAEDMLFFAKNPNVTRAGDWKTIRSINQAQAKIKRSIEMSEEWAIVAKNAGDFKIIGSIGMRTSIGLKEFKACKDFGYVLAEEYWGQGLCTEAVGKLMHYVFVGLQCDAISVCHRVFNNRSKRVIEKNHFKYRGTYPKNKQEDPLSKVCYVLSKEDYMKMHGISEFDLEKDVYRIQQSYSYDNPIRVISDINYVKQPTKYQSGQTCVAMLAEVSVKEVIDVMSEDGQVSDEGIDKALNYYGINHRSFREAINENTILPDLCILSLHFPDYAHWSLYYKGTFYDPEFGILKELPENATLSHYWPIYEGQGESQRFIRGSVWLPEVSATIKSPYTQDAPIRKIDSIKYLKQPTPYLCGQACVAMLAGVEVQDVINIINHDKGTSRVQLQIALKHYGIKYAPKTIKYEEGMTMPKICILDIKMPGYSHWSLYYDGKFYDPEFGIRDGCPEGGNLARVWKIYSD